MRYLVSCRTCGERWIDGDDLHTSDVAASCPCPPPLEFWDVSRAPTPQEALAELQAARYELDQCIVPGGCPACRHAAERAIATSRLAALALATTPCVP